MSKPDLPSNAWSLNQNESIFESGIPLQNAFKADEVQRILH